MADSTDAAGSGALQFFSTAGTILNFVLFLSQIPLYRQLVKAKDAAPYTYMPSVMLLLACSFWSGYVLMTLPNPTGQLIAANVVGIFVAIFYLGIYAFFSLRPVKVKLLAYVLLIQIVCWGFYGAITSMGWQQEELRTFAGLVTVSINMLFFLAPLGALRTAWKEMDYSKMPLTLIVVQLDRKSVV